MHKVIHLYRNTEPRFHSLYCHWPYPTLTVYVIEKLFTLLDLLLAFLKLCEIFQEQCDVVMDYSVTGYEIDIKMVSLFIEKYGRCTEISQGLCYLLFSPTMRGCSLESSI